MKLRFILGIKISNRCSVVIDETHRGHKMMLYNVTVGNSILW